MALIGINILNSVSGRGGSGGRGRDHDRRPSRRRNDDNDCHRRLKRDCDSHRGGRDRGRC